MVKDALTVPGENLPLILALALTLGGGACAFAATLWYQDHQGASLSGDLSTKTPASSPVGTPQAPASALASAASSTRASASRAPDSQAPASYAPASTAPAPASNAPAPASNAPAPTSVASAASAAPASAKPQPPARRDERVARAAGCLLGTMPFKRGFKRPAPDQQAMLPVTLAWLQAEPSRRLLLRGHSDAGGTDGYNLRLSAARARWIRTWLVKRGIEPERITAQAFGEYLPVMDARPDDARQRRVEVIGMGGPCPTP